MNTLFETPLKEFVKTTISTAIIASKNNTMSEQQILNFYTDLIIKKLNEVLTNGK